MEENKELTEQEKKLIRTYCFLPVSAVAAFLIFVLSIVLSIVMTMIGDMEFELVWFGNFDYALPSEVFAVLYGVYIIYALLRTRYGLQGKRWQEIVRKVPHVRASGDSAQYARAASRANTLRAAGSLTRSSAAQAAGTAGEAAAVGGMALAMFRQAGAVADAAGVPRPKMRKVILPVAILTALLTIVYYIPGFVVGYQSTQARIDTITVSENLIKDAFSDLIADSYGSDLSKGQREYTLTIVVDEDTRDHVYIMMDRDGVVQGISYYANVDPEAEKEDVLDRAEAVFAQMYERLASSGVPVEDESLLTEPVFPEQFREEFLAGDAETSLYVRQDSLYCTYDFIDSYESAAENGNITLGILL